MLRREAAGASVAASRAIPGAIRGVSGNGGGRAPAVSDRSHPMVVCLVGNHAQEAGSMSRGSVSASKEGGDLRGGSEALGGSLGEAINESVGPPIDGGEELAIAQLRHPDSFLRLVRGHPHELSSVDDAGEVVPDNVRHHRPDPGKRSVVVGGTGVASKRSGEEGLAISAYGGHERAVSQHREHGPRFGRGSSVAPRGWPAEPIGNKVAVGRDSGKAEAGAPDGTPSPVDERPIAVPRDAAAACEVVRQGDDPTERPINLEGRDRNLEHQQAMKLEVSLPLLGNRRDRKAGGRRRGRPPPFRHSGHTVEPMLEGADRIEAELAPVVINAEVAHRSFPGLRPLSTTSS